MIGWTQLGDWQKTGSHKSSASRRKVLWLNAAFSNYHLLILKIPSLKDEIDTRSPHNKRRQWKYFTSCYHRKAQFIFNLNSFSHYNSREKSNWCLDWYVEGSIQKSDGQDLDLAEKAHRSHNVEEKSSIIWIRGYSHWWWRAMPTVRKGYSVVRRSTRPRKSKQRLMDKAIVPVLISSLFKF